MIKSVYDPLPTSALEPEDVRWFLEDHSPNDPYESGRAKKVALGLTNYGRLLAAQLKSLPFALVSAQAWQSS